MANTYEQSPAAPAQLAYTVGQACEVLSIGRTVLFDLIRNKEITSVKVGRRRVIVAASLETYLNRLVAEQSDSALPHH